MNSILIGSVNSSQLILEQMIKTDFPVSIVFSLDEQYSEPVSGYSPLHETAARHTIPYKKFRKINDQENIEMIKNSAPDYIFVIGLSQLVSKEIINAAKNGVIGFHPTPLPQYRGRAAIVWQILLGVRETKCTLFFIDEGMDSGNIIAQEPYLIEDSDYAIDAENKCLAAFECLLQRVLPQLKNGLIQAIPQNEAEATYLLKRSPEDGLIEWNQSAEAIQRLVRAVSKPYPGAFCYYKGRYKTIIWRADYLTNDKYIGIPGQIAKVTNEYIDIVCHEGILRVNKNFMESDEPVNYVEGHKFRSYREGSTIA